MKKSVFLSATIIAMLLVGCGSNDFPNVVPDVTASPMPSGNSGNNSNNGNNNNPPANNNNQPSNTPSISEPSKRFKLMIAGSDNIRQDLNRKLDWVASRELGNNTFLSENVTTQSEDLIKSNAFCGNLGYGGYNNWRVPTVSENEDFIKSMKAENISPAYADANCKMVIGLNANSKAYGTFTHNDSAKLGTSQIWKSLIDLSESTSRTIKYGVKCVRNHN